MNHSLRVVVLLLVALFPLLPRPTVEHAAALSVPLVAAALAFIIASFLLVRPLQLPKTLNYRAFLFLCAVLVTTYFMSNFLAAEPTWNKFVGKMLWLMVFVGLSLALCGNLLRGVDVINFYFAGILAGCLVAGMVSVTGVDVFGVSVIPGRSYGIQIPLDKTTGVPRSFGEFGNILAFGWAIFLTMGDRYGKRLRMIALGLLVLGVLVAQSRSTYLSIVAIVAAMMALRVFTARVWVYAVVISAIICPVLLDTIMDLLGAREAVSGEGVLQQNVLNRYLMMALSIDKLVFHFNEYLVFGLPISEWFAEAKALTGHEEVLHNYYLSSLLFLGIIGGLSLLWISQIRPFILMGRYRNADLTRGPLGAVFLGSVGSAVNLHFYEGFFSLILAVHCALLVAYSVQANET